MTRIYSRVCKKCYFEVGKASRSGKGEWLFTVYFILGNIRGRAAPRDGGNVGRKRHARSQPGSLQKSISQVSCLLSHSEFLFVFDLWVLFYSIGVFVCMTLAG